MSTTPAVSFQCASPSPSVTNCTPSQQSICVQVTNLSGETLNVNAINETNRNYTLCFQVPTMAAGATPYTVQFAPLSSWTIQGNTSGNYYLQNQIITNSQHFQISKLPTFVNFGDKSVDWLPLAIGGAATTLAIAVWGHAVNSKNRKKYCDLHPDKCTLNLIHNPKTGKAELKGYPPGFKKNGWIFPFVLALLITVGLFLGYLASMGSFGYSPLTAQQCSTRQPSSYWFWTSRDASADPTYNGKAKGWNRFLARWLGLGTCIDPNAQANCILLQNDFPTHNIAYNNTAAQSANPGVFECACVDSTANTNWNCDESSGNTNCTQCAATTS